MFIPPRIASRLLVQRAVVSICRSARPHSLIRSRDTESGAQIESEEGNCVDENDNRFSEAPNPELQHPEKSQPPSFKSDAVIPSEVEESRCRTSNSFRGILRLRSA